MGPYIASATNNIRSIIEEIVISEKSDIRLALVEYRDHPPQVNINEQQAFSLTVFHPFRIRHSSPVCMILQQEPVK